jgi:hypothetical protein
LKRKKAADTIVRLPSCNLAGHFEYWSLVLKQMQNDSATPTLH